ncbi:MAG: MjaI family restriction endonuclease [Planctomycetota bacterium]
MAKEWILNMATNRWGLNKKNRVGPVSDWIRESSPRVVSDWETAYCGKFAGMLEEQGIDLPPQEYLDDLGHKLFVKINEVLQAEMEVITEEDCLSYIRGLVITRTFDGYQTEIKTIYGQLQAVLGVPIQPASDDWDRRYNVDFYIQMGGKYIGLQIKPITYNQTPELYRWKEWMEKSHQQFRARFGGEVFIIFSIKSGDNKTIMNQDIVDEIRREIERLS